VLAKKGPLGKIWLAAHMEKKVPKIHIIQTNIPCVSHPHTAARRTAEPWRALSLARAARTGTQDAAIRLAASASAASSALT
jgi:hypothetical protein